MAAPPHCSRQYTLQEVFQHEELQRQLSNCGTHLQQGKQGEVNGMRALRGTRTLFLSLKQELMGQGELLALMGKLEREMGLTIQTPSKPISVEIAVNAENKPNYNVCIVSAGRGWVWLCV